MPNDTEQLLALRAEYRKLGCCPLCSLWAALGDTDSSWQERRACSLGCLALIARYREQRGPLPSVRSPAGTSAVQDPRVRAPGVPEPKSSVGKAAGWSDTREAAPVNTIRQNGIRGGKQVEEGVSDSVQSKPWRSGIRPSRPVR